MMANRINQVGNATVSALLLLPAAGEPGYPSPGELAAGLAMVVRARLGPRERLGFAIAGMLSLDRAVAEKLAEAILHDLRSGPPVPPFLDMREDARSWATFASPAELRAYMAACWQRLPDRDRGGFLRTVRHKRRAA